MLSVLHRLGRSTWLNVNKNLPDLEKSIFFVIMFRKRDPRSVVLTTRIRHIGVKDRPTGAGTAAK